MICIDENRDVHPETVSEGSFFRLFGAPTTPQCLEFAKRKDFSRNLRVTFGVWLVAICGSQRHLKKPKVLVTFENYRMMA